MKKNPSLLNNSTTLVLNEHIFFCTSKGVFKLYFFRNKTLILIPEMIAEAVECLKGSCDTNILYMLLEQQNAELINQFKLANVSEIQSLILPAASNISQQLLGPILPGICVNASQVPIFLLLAPEGYTVKNFAEDALKKIKGFADIIFERNGRNLFTQDQCGLV